MQRSFLTQNALLISILAAAAINLVAATRPTSAAVGEWGLAAVDLVKGGLKFEAFLDIPGSSVDSLLQDPKYKSNMPDEVAYVTEFTSRRIYRDGSHDNYGGRISGWIVPEETGEYEFFLRSNDASRLFLSSDDNSENALLIAEETSCCGPFEEPGAPETSAPQQLKMGQRYYTYAIWKEGGGADFCDVAWRKVGDPTAANSLPYIPGRVLETYAAPGTFLPPAIAIVSPPDGTTFELGSPVTLVSNPTAAAGKRVTLVEFFDAGIKIDQASSSPYSVVLTNLVPDVHVFMARVIDSAGLYVDSAPVQVTVGTPPIKITLLTIDDQTTWRYDRSGADLGKNWREADFNDSQWPEGKSLIAGEDSPTVEPIRTDISRFNDAGDYVTTFYFRTHFAFTNAISAGTTLQMRHVIDDGVVFYLNGVEVLRFGMPAEAINAQTYALGHENAWEGPVEISVASLIRGDNVLAAEVHQSGPTSSDIVFGAELIVRLPGQTPELERRFQIPVVQAGKVVLVWTGVGILQASSAVIGPWSDVVGVKSPFAASSLGEARMFYRVR